MLRKGLVVGCILIFNGSNFAGGFGPSLVRDICLNSLSSASAMASPSADIPSSFAARIMDSIAALISLSETNCILAPAAGTVSLGCILFGLAFDATYPLCFVFVYGQSRVQLLSYFFSDINVVELPANACQVLVKIKANALK